SSTMARPTAPTAASKAAPIEIPLNELPLGISRSVLGAARGPIGRIRRAARMLPGASNGPPAIQLGIHSFLPEVDREEPQESQAASSPPPSRRLGGVRGLVIVFIDGGSFPRSRL